MPPKKRQAPSDINRLRSQNNSLEKQRSYAWAKYYEEVNQNHNTGVNNLNQAVRIVEKPEIPDIIKNELIDLMKNLRKTVECPVCYDVIEPDDMKLTNCGHKYCNTCYNKLIETTNKCAICRKKIKWN